MNLVEGTFDFSLSCVHVQDNFFAIFGKMRQYNGLMTDLRCY